MTGEIEGEGLGSGAGAGDEFAADLGFEERRFFVF